jgi:hypothetical protein
VHRARTSRRTLVQVRRRSGKRLGRFLRFFAGDASRARRRRESRGPGATSRLMHPMGSCQPLQEGLRLAAPRLPTARFTAPFRDHELGISAPATGLPWRSRNLPTRGRAQRRRADPRLALGQVPTHRHGDREACQARGRARHSGSAPAQWNHGRSDLAPGKPPANKKPQKSRSTDPLTP